MNIRRCAAGFTLIEILVTVALTSLVVGMGFKVIISAQEIARIQEEQSAAARDGWSLVYRLSKELREAVPPSQLGEGFEWSGTASTGKSLFDTVSTVNWSDASKTAIKEAKVNQAPVFSDTIRFCTLHVTSPNHATAPGMVEYSLEPDAAKGVINVVRRSVVAGVPWDQAEKEVIRRTDISSLGFVSLQFQYLDSQGTWQAKGWTDKNTMPRAVRISVGTFVRPSRVIRVPVLNQNSTLVYLPTDSRIPQ